jgi:flagellin-specific chaperone FliS
MNKASVEELNNLHGMVANQLATLVREGDLKAIEKAISFLKNNNITADIVESKPQQDLFTSISNTVDNNKDKKIETVEELLKAYS